MATFKKILVANDLSAASEPALAQALDLAHELSAQLVVLHVTEPPYQAREWFTPIAEREQELYRAVARREEDAAKARLDAQLARRSAAGVKLQTMAISGAAAEVICATAMELGCDLIVMGTHGRKGVAHVVLGSIAERVVRVAPIPVLTVRGPARPSA